MDSVRFAFILLVALVAVAPLAQARRGFELECHMLPVDQCAFAVSSRGFRCILEKSAGSDDLICLTSDITVGLESPVEYIETDACIRQCGVDRMTIGFSTDELNAAEFVSSVCSTACREECPNLFDLYSNIVSGEGVKIGDFCGEKRRIMLSRARFLTVAEAPTWL